MANIVCEVLKVLWSSEPDKKGNRIDIRVVRWGKSNPTLEKRHIWWDDANEEERFRKMIGLNVDDFKIITAHQTEICALLGEDNNG